MVFRRGAGLVEHWAARERGLQLWVELFELPRRGELALRYELGGALGAAELDGSRAVFRVPGLGGAVLGGVLGIDARGRTARGDLRAVPGGIELVLPAAFVEEAALPLIVDPLLTPLHELELPNDDLAPAIAHEPGSGHYLVAWELVFSAADTDVYCWRRGADGEPVGFLSGVAASSADEREPAVGANPNTGEFVIAYARQGTGGDYDVYAREMNAASGFLGAAAQVLGGAADQREPVLSDEAPGLPGDHDVLIGWRVAGDGLYFGRLRHPATGGPLVIGATPLAGPDGIHLSVTPSGGLAGRHLFAWESTANGFGGSTSQIITGTVVSRTGAVLYDSPFLEIAYAWELHEPAAVGDGTRFYVAHVFDDTATASSVRVRELRWNGQGLDLVNGAATVSATDGQLASPAAALVGDQLLVAWEYAGVFFFFGLRYTALDAATLTACEPELALPSSVLFQRDLAIASGGADRALVSWSDYDVAVSAGNVHVQPFVSATAAAGQVDLGGGTAGGGTGYAPCAFVGNGSFALELRDHAPSSLAFLILGNELLGLPCGGGVLHVDPFQSWVIQGSPGTVSAVEKLVPLSIPDDPALAGASLHAQWATKHAAGPCPLFGVELSNALRFTVQ